MEKYFTKKKKTKSHINKHETLTNFIVHFAPLSKRKYTFEVMSRSSKLEAERDNCRKLILQ